jgi:DNA polymerase III subunit epsilon
MSNSFTAIDFETANPQRNSICQVGIVRIENDLVTQSISVLVQPPDNYYWDRFVDIHGISPRHTQHAPTFDKIWPQIEPFIEDQNLVAHNGFGFDFPCLKNTMAFYNMAPANFSGHCTYKIYKKGLAALCNQYNITLKHHDALSDAMACAKLFIMHKNNGSLFGG